MDVLKIGIGVFIILLIFYAMRPILSWMVNYARDIGNLDWFEIAILMLIPALILFFGIKYFISGRNPNMIGGGYDY